jgi:membrane-associated phospholipid phosphatase
MAANLISLSFIGTVAVPVALFLQTEDTFYMWLPAGIISMNMAIEGVKHILGSAGVLGRPDAAVGCDLFCIGGPVGGQPGFPSGHVAAVTMCVTAINLHTKNRSWILWVGILWIIAMAWARWYKHCHNVSQIMGGMFVGFVCGALMSNGFRTDHVQPMPCLSD